MSKILKESLIIEAPIVQTPIVESKTKTKARMKAILQRLNVPGRNSRRYPAELVESELKSKQGLMKARTFLGELDHPITDDPVRNSIVALQNASHVILEAWIEGELVKGVVETLTTPYGQILYNLAAVDNVPVGFSLRALGSLKPQGTILDVVRMTMITYDAVSHPSFTEARIQEVSLAEALQYREKFEQDQQVFLEHDQICINGKCYLVEHLDKVLSSEIVKAIHKVLWSF